MTKKYFVRRWPERAFVFKTTIVMLSVFALAACAPKPLTMRQTVDDAMLEVEEDIRSEVFDDFVVKTFARCELCAIPEVNVVAGNTTDYGCTMEEARRSR